MIDPELAAAFREREMRVERTVNLLRLAGCSVLSASDFVGLRSMGLVTPRILAWYAGLIALFVAASLGIHRLATAGVFRPWLKYLSIALDYTLIATVFLFYASHRIWFGLSADGFTGLFAETCLLFTMLAGLRRGIAPLAISASLGVLCVSWAGWYLGAQPMAAAFGALAVVLGGALAWATSRGVTALFVRVRRRERLTRFLSPDLVTRIDSGEIALEPGGVTRTVTILFSDIRGFTHLSEKMAPADLVTHLNEYLARMTAIVFEHHGAVDKFVGDAVMAVFGAPASSPDDARRAVETAEAMLVALDELNADWAARGRPTLAIGIGLHTGPAVAGMIGSREKLEYTVIGDTVNVASRIESLNKELGTRLLMSEATWRAAGSPARARPLPETHVRGRDEAVRLHAIEPDETNAAPGLARA